MKELIRVLQDWLLIMVGAGFILFLIILPPKIWPHVNKVHAAKAEVTETSTVEKKPTINTCLVATGFDSARRSAILEWRLC